MWLTYYGNSHNSYTSLSLEPLYPEIVSNMHNQLDVSEAEDSHASRESPVQPEIPDFLREIRDLRLRVRAGVYAAVTGSLLINQFALHLSPLQMAVMSSISVLISLAAVEGAFIKAFKLRKHSAYPGAMFVQLGQVDSLAAAYRSGLAALGKLLNLSGSFLCLQQSGSLSLVAITGISRLQTDQFLRLGAANIQQVIASSVPAAFRPSADLLSEAVVPPGLELVFVPVRCLQRTIGVLGLLAHDSNRDIRDDRLISGIGLALGLALENLRQKEELGQQAAMDELTGVYNRRYFFDEMAREMAFTTRYSSPLAVAILDVDGLKGVNDRLGHAAGDEVLRTVALRLVRYSRASDLVARIGGDEFALILPRTDSQAAREMASRLQWAVEQQPVTLSDGQDLSVAVSCGTASCPEDAEDADALVRRADAIMYCVKAARRNPTNA